MRSEPLTGSTRGNFWRRSLLVFSVGASLALAYPGEAGHRQHLSLQVAGGAAFQLVADPVSQRITAGSVARYQISLIRGHYRGKVKLALARPRAGLAAGLARAGTRANGSALRSGVTLRVSDKRALLTVMTGLSLAPRVYVLKVSAAGGPFRKYLTLGLVVVPPQAAPFTISGKFAPLWPGVSAPVDLALTNPSSQPITVSSLKVALVRISAPHATGALPCSAADFGVRQFSGSYPLTVPARATVHLSALGVSAALQPQVTMLDRPVDQDGCEGATLTLSYSGTASSK